MKYLKRYGGLYAVTLTLFLVIDLIWLGVITPAFYFKQLGYIMRTDVYWAPAFFLYLLLVIGLLIFAVVPALRRRSLSSAMIYGGLFGFFSYATYDLTNYATITGWPFVVTVVDIIWGTVLCGSISAFSFLVGNRVFKLSYPSHTV